MQLLSLAQMLRWCAHYLNLYRFSCISCHKVNFFHIIPCCRSNIYRICISDVPVKIDKLHMIWRKGFPNLETRFKGHCLLPNKWRFICSFYCSNTNLHNVTDILWRIWVRFKISFSETFWILNFTFILTCMYLTKKIPDNHEYQSFHFPGSDNIKRTYNYRFMRLWALKNDIFSSATNCRQVKGIRSLLIYVWSK